MPTRQKKVKFKNKGRNNQHEITLFEVNTCDVKMSDILADCTNDMNAQTYAEKALTHYWEQSKEYLKAYGFEEPEGYFKLINGEILKSETLWMPLWAVIEERNNSLGGQRGDYLAAIIEHKSRTLLGNWPPNPNNYSAVLDNVMQIQEFFFQLFLLEKVHAQYSAGNSRIENAQEEKNKRKKFEVEAEKIFKKIKEEKIKNKIKYSKEACYAGTENRLKELYGKKGPKASAIKSWFKSREDLKTWWSNIEKQYKAG